MSRDLLALLCVAPFFLAWLLLLTLLATGWEPKE